MSRNSEHANFNNPFAQLKQRLKQTGRQDASGGVLPAPVCRDMRHTPAMDDGALFAQAMQGVEALADGKGRVLPLVKQPGLGPIQTIDEELEVMAHLAELVASETPLCLSWQRGFVRGAVQGVDPALLAMLEAGRFPVQDYLDLHGLALEEALGKVEDFLRASRAHGLRHVLIVHGKGRGSRGGESVLKETLSRCLCHKRFARLVLAFCSAKPQDGGTGAMYVLLKNWQGPTIFASRAKP